MSTLRPVPEKSRPPVLRTWAEQKLKLPLCSDALCGDLSSTLGSLPRQRSFRRHEGGGEKPPNRTWTRKWPGAALRPPKPPARWHLPGPMSPLVQGWLSLLGSPLSPCPLIGLPRAARLQWENLEASACWGFPRLPSSRSRRPPGWVPGRACRFQPPWITWLHATWGQNQRLGSGKRVAPCLTWRKKLGSVGRSETSTDPFIWWAWERKSFGS